MWHCKWLFSIFNSLEASFFNAHIYNFCCLTSNIRFIFLLIMFAIGLVMFYFCIIFYSCKLSRIIYSDFLNNFYHHNTLKSSHFLFYLLSLLELSLVKAFLISEFPPHSSIDDRIDTKPQLEWIFIIKLPSTFRQPTLCSVGSKHLK